jgi:hypothetical protein
MKSHTVLLLAVAALSWVGCNKKTDDTATPSGSASGTVTATTPSVAANSGKCVDGAYKDPNGIYCVKVPDGYTPPKATRKDSSKSTDQFETSDGFNFVIKYWKPDNAAEFGFAKDRFSSESDTLKKTASSDFEGGNGLYVERHDTKSKQTSTASVVKSGAMLITCESGTLDDKPLKPADACKTLRGM